MTLCILYMGRQHENGEKAAAALQERRKHLTALQTNLARDRQELTAHEEEIVRPFFHLWFARVIVYTLCIGVWAGGLGAWGLWAGWLDLDRWCWLTDMYILCVVCVP